MYHEAGAARPSVVAAATTAGDEGEGKEEEDAVLSRPATRRAYLSKVSGGMEGRIRAGLWWVMQSFMVSPFTHTTTTTQNTKQNDDEQDGTPLVWDAPTLLELRAGQHMLSRAVGVGSIRVSVLQKVRRAGWVSGVVVWWYTDVWAPTILPHRKPRNTNNNNRRCPRPSSPRRSPSPSRRASSGARAPFGTHDCSRRMHIRICPCI